MNRIVISIVVLVGYVSISAQSIALNGTVSDSKGNPIKGANVLLGTQKQIVTTDSKGAYSLSSTVAIETPDPIRPVIDAISIVNNMMNVNVSGPVTIKIERFDIRGNLLERITDKVTSAGMYHFDPFTRSFAAGMMILRVEAGSVSATFRSIPSKNGNQLVAASASEVSSGCKLAKTAAVVDTLFVSASGYKTKSVPLSSYSGKNDVSLDTSDLALFSFFVTSLNAIQELSKSKDGFGGDFRFGKTGQGAGLLGADSICQCIAERSMKGSAVKKWRAFLSVAKGPDGQQVNAIDRIGAGPWYDRIGLVVALTRSDLLYNRPKSIDEDIKEDLPNEDGVPNHRPDPTKPTVDNHLTVTGSDSTGRLFSATATCEDWTSTSANSKPRSGLSWTRKGFGGFGKTTTGIPGGGTQMMTNMQNWISVWSLPGCEAGIDLAESTGAGKPGVKIIGSGGGYGGFYCFALTP